MARPLLLVVTGRTGSGKTTLARRLATDAGMPLIAKDSIKESLYDTLGARTRPESRRLGGAALTLQRVIAGELLRAEVSLILEANYRDHFDGAPLRALVAEYNARVAQIWLTSDAATLERRVMERVESGERHPGHMELANLDEIRRDLTGAGDAPLALPGPVLALDTTKFSDSAYITALAFLRLAAHGATMTAGSL